MVFFETPNYPELAVKNVWPLVKENKNLLKFFLDFKLSQLPEKDFMCGILSSVRLDEERELETQSVKVRSPVPQDD